MVQEQTLVIQAHFLNQKTIQTFSDFFYLPTPFYRTDTAAYFKLDCKIDDKRLALFANEAKTDASIMPYGVTLDEIGLYVSDMDSTLITIECIDEIADAIGIKDRVAEITERSMQGELDFSQSLIARVKLLQAVPIQALDEIYQDKLHLMAGAEALLKSLNEANIPFLLVSGGFSYFTDKLKHRLGLDWSYANQLEVIDNKLTGKIVGKILDAETKRQLLIEKREQLGLGYKQVIAIGDGANDLPMLKEAGFGIAFHAKPKVQAQTTLQLNWMGLNGVAPLFHPL